MAPWHVNTGDLVSQQVSWVSPVHPTGVTCSLTYEYRGPVLSTSFTNHRAGYANIEEVIVSIRSPVRLECTSEWEHQAFEVGTTVSHTNWIWELLMSGPCMIPCWAGVKVLHAWQVEPAHGGKSISSGWIYACAHKCHLHISHLILRTEFSFQKVKITRKAGVWIDLWYYSSDRITATDGHSITPQSFGRCLERW